MTRITLLPLIACLALFTLGCETMQNLLADMDKPTARITNARLDSLSLQQAGLIFDVEIQNPYSVALPLTRVSYGLSSADASLVKGEAGLEGTIPAGKSKVVSLPVSLVFNDLMKAGASIRPGQVLPYQADMKFAVDAPGVGELALPVSQKGEVPVPAVPTVAVTSVKFDQLTLTNAGGVVSLDVTNTNSFNIDLKKLGYSLSLGGSTVGTSEVTGAANLKPGEKTSLQIPIRFTPMNLGTGALNMLKGSGSSFEIAGDMQLGTKFGDLNLPYQQKGKTAFEK